MKTIDKITNDKDLRWSEYYIPKNFLEDAKRWCKAMEEGRMMCIIHKVSASGMSRTMSFYECAQSQRVTPKRFYYLNFWGFMNCMKYSAVKDTDHFRISGCGMDMVFNTNYNIIHKIHRLGIIKSERCAKLSKDRPISLY